MIVVADTSPINYLILTHTLTSFREAIARLQEARFHVAQRVIDEMLSDV